MSKSNGHKALSDFRPQRANANKHKPFGLKLIGDSIQRDGYSAPMVAAADGEIFAGSARLEAVGDVLNAEPIIVHSDGTRPVIHVRDDIPNADDPKARRLGVADNVIARIDYEPDGGILAALAADDDILKQMIAADEMSMKAIADYATPEPADAEPQMDRAEELNRKWKVKRGDLWRIGEHRLLCGDSTVREDVARVMGEGVFWDLCFTSPPYNSGIGGYKSDYYGKRSNFYVDDTDNRTESEWIEFCNSILSVASEFCASDESVVLWNVMYTAKTRRGYGVVMFSGNHPFTVKETICWDKGRGFPSASRGILSRNWELIFVLSKGDKYLTTQSEHEVRWAKWETTSKSQNEINHATFPVELVCKGLTDFGGAIIYDPFAGSGTTLIACQNLNRRCRAIEISPAYCAVILQRMQTAFPGTEIERLP